MSIQRLMIPICALIGVAALFLFGRRVWSASVDDTEPFGITIRSETLTIYAPKALIDFAKAPPEITTDDELVLLIHAAKPEVWFPTAIRNHQANGIVADIPISYRAGEKPVGFDTAKDLLLILAGKRPEPATVDCTEFREFRGHYTWVPGTPSSGVPGTLYLIRPRSSGDTIPNSASAPSTVAVRLASMSLVVVAGYPGRVSRRAS
jgi:hypothetical protein